MYNIVCIDGTACINIVCIDGTACINIVCIDGTACINIVCIDGTACVFGERRINLNETVPCSRDITRNHKV